MNAAMTTAPVPSSPAPAATPAEQAHLRYLDGLRGLAALYIVLFHTQMHLRAHTPHSPLPVWLNPLLDFFLVGHAAVCVFIVLSGYVLMLPVVRSGDNRLRGGVAGFIKRRARRILPTYYVALLLFSVLAIAAHYLPTPEGHLRRSLSPISFFEHVFLVQNLDVNRWFDIDGPMWSLATEWQIYFVFALVLLPLYRRVGVAATLLFAGIVSLVPHFVLPAANNLDQTAPWFLFLFALGMGAARWSFSADAACVRLRQNVPWGWATGLIFGLFVLLVHPAWMPAYMQDLLNQQPWMWEALCGLATAALLLFCTVSVQKTPPGQQPALLVRALQSRFCVGLGAFSYSLYLVHQPIVGLVVEALYWKRLHLPTAVIWSVSFATLPFVVAIGYGFYLLFERPFVMKTGYKLPYFKATAKIASLPPNKGGG